MLATQPKAATDEASGGRAQEIKVQVHMSSGPRHPLPARSTGLSAPRPSEPLILLL